MLLILFSIFSKRLIVMKGLLLLSQGVLEVRENKQKILFASSEIVYKMIMPYSFLSLSLSFLFKKKIICLIKMVKILSYKRTHN